MRNYRYAICYVSPSPLNCRTGYQVTRTFRTLAAARQRLSEIVGAGFYLAQREGDNYVRIASNDEGPNAPAMECAA